MSGSDEVGVDPGRVSQAAAALENLRDVLAARYRAWHIDRATPDLKRLPRAAA